MSSEWARILRLADQSNEDEEEKKNGIDRT
jgi:hypothetical protein